MDKKLSKIVSLLFLSIFFASIITLPVLAEETFDDVTQGMLIGLDNQNRRIEIPIKHTDVNVEISGMVADVEVTQIYQNDLDVPIEAVYVFPLPNDAAVYSMTMKIGDRTIKGIIKEREEAKQIYEEAKEDGKTSSLLEQERPNIFTQSIANIAPEDEIKITIRYFHELKYVDGTFEFSFPMVVGPRYVPYNRVGEESLGWSYDKIKPTDGARITPPMLAPYERSGHDISIDVTIDAGIPIKGVRSKSHSVITNTIDAEKSKVTLSEFDAIPNKDFILEYDVAGEKPEFGILTHKSLTSPEGYFTLIIQPPKLTKDSDVTNKEMVFVIDTSGSMNGQPLDAAKAAMRESITKMNPGDTFRIVRFSNDATGLSTIPLQNTPENVKKGLEYVDNLKAGGGTNMREGILAALYPPKDPKRMRIVFFMTDGYIGNEDEVLGLIQSNIGESRIFPLGIGSSVNRYLLDQMAKQGRGTTQYVIQDENTSLAVQTFYDRISKPLLTDIEIDWKSLKVAELYPQKIPDMFSSQPVYIHGKYLTPGKENIRISAKVRGEPVSISVPADFTAWESDHSSIRLLWARDKIGELSEKMYKAEDAQIVKEITKLGVSYSLMTKYTSFVAVEERFFPIPSDTKTIIIPLPLPAGNEKGQFANNEVKPSTINVDSSSGGEGNGIQGIISGAGSVLNSVKEAVQAPASSQYVTSSASGKTNVTIAGATNEIAQSLTTAGGGGGGGAIPAGIDSNIDSAKASAAGTTEVVRGTTDTPSSASKKNIFAEYSTATLWVFMLFSVLGFFSWAAFQHAKKKNVMLVSFHDAKGKRIAQALANETCKRILEILANGELPAGEIAKRLGMSIARVQYNLKALQDAKLVQVKHFDYSEKGREMDLYSLTNKYFVIGPPEKHKKK